MPIVEASELYKIYRPGSAAEVRAVNGVTIAIPEGSFAFLTGPSGSGKTTLLSLIGGLERATGGTVVFAGRDLNACSDAELTRLRRRIGFVFQDFALIPRLPVWENMTYPLVPRGVPRAERYGLATEWLGKFGLGDRLAACPSELSGGEMQRVSIARAFAGQPDLILADEPTSNLDEESAGIVIEMLNQFHAGCKTVIVSSHDPRIESLADVRVRLSKGKLTSVSGK